MNVFYTIFEKNYKFKKKRTTLFRHVFAFKAGLEPFFRLWIDLLNNHLQFFNNKKKYTDLIFYCISLFLFVPNYLMHPVNAFVYVFQLIFQYNILCWYNCVYISYLYTSRYTNKVNSNVKTNILAKQIFIVFSINYFIVNALNSLVNTNDIDSTLHSQNFRRDNNSDDL